MPSSLIAGIMSGTSLDGIDVAFVRIEGSGSDLRFELAGFHAIPYDAELKVRLLDASAGRMSLREAFELDADLGAIYGDAICEAAERCGISLDAIDAVGLHGQTVYHAPRREPHGVTVQLGSAAAVVERVRSVVVSDFRTADVAAGGEGAPLVPYCDYALLHSPERNRVALNIGGIANITWLPRDARPESLVAFDTGPGNMMIDAAMRELRGLDFDEDGALASQGSPDHPWLEEMLRDEYYDSPPPKSAGRERFGEDRGRELARAGRERGLHDADIVATLALLTARTIALAIDRFASRGADPDEVIVGGGGARNQALMRMLGEELPGSTILDAGEFGLPADAKEAICFAILANEALKGIPANVPSVTGAARPVICGAIRRP